MTACLDFGWYVRPDGRRALLTWWEDSKAVTLDGPGGVELLGFIATEHIARRIFADWSDEEWRPIAWVRARMAAAICADCGGRGVRLFNSPFQRGETLEAACPTCTPVEAS